MKWLILVFVLVGCASIEEAAKKVDECGEDLGVLQKYCQKNNP